MHLKKNVEVLVFWDSTCRNRWLVEETVSRLPGFYGKSGVNTLRTGDADLRF